MYINQKSFLNMKQINKLLVILLALVTFSSCETYGDYEIEYTAIYLFHIHKAFLINIHL